MKNLKEFNNFINETLNNDDLPDRIYNALMTVDEIKKMDTDQVGEVYTAIAKQLKKFGFKL